MGAPRLANSLRCGGLRWTESGALKQAQRGHVVRRNGGADSRDALSNRLTTERLYEVMAQIQAAREGTDGNRPDPPTINRQADVSVFIEQPHCNHSPAGVEGSCGRTALRPGRRQLSRQVGWIHPAVLAREREKSVDIRRREKTARRFTDEPSADADGRAGAQEIAARTPCVTQSTYALVCGGKHGLWPGYELEPGQRPADVVYCSHSSKVISAFACATVGRSVTVCSPHDCDAAGTLSASP